MPHPAHSLQDVLAWLTPAGCLIFSQSVQPPNITDIRGAWWYLAPRNGHVSLFTVETLNRLLPSPAHALHGNGWLWAMVPPAPHPTLAPAMSAIGPVMAAHSLFAPASGADDAWHAPETSPAGPFRWSKTPLLKWTLPPSPHATHLTVRIPFTLEIEPNFAARCQIQIGNIQAQTTISPTRHHRGSPNPPLHHPHHHPAATPPSPNPPSPSAPPQTPAPSASPSPSPDSRHSVQRHPKHCRPRAITAAAILAPPRSGGPSGRAPTINHRPIDGRILYPLFYSWFNRTTPKRHIYYIKQDALMEISAPPQPSRRTLLRHAALGATGLAGGLATSSTAPAAAPASRNTVAPNPRTGPVGFTSFIHPTVRARTTAFSIGAASLIEGFVSLQGASAILGNAANLQDNDRLLNFTSDTASAPGDLIIGDGSFTAHNVTFIGYVRIGQACGTVIRAVVQNAIVNDASLTGFTAHIRGTDPRNPIVIPEASLVLFGARINKQADVAANIIPIPAGFALFASDVDQENLLLARAYNLLYRAAARITPFSSSAGAPGNPGDSFPNVASAFGQFSLGPPTLDRRGTGVIPARQATLNDLGFAIYPPLSPVPTLATPAPDKGGINAPPSDSAEAGARFITPRIASPELVSQNAIVIGGVELESGVTVGPESYLHGGDAPAVSVGAGTTIGRNVSIHELTFTSVTLGKQNVIGDRAVLHGPLLLGNNVSVGEGTVLFGPTVSDGVKIGKNVLIFGPVAVTADVPDNAIIVPQGEEGLVAPSHKGPRGSLKQSAEAARPWKLAQACGRGCGCGLTTRLQAFG